MFKSILLAATLALGLGASHTASAVSFGGFGGTGAGSGSSCVDSSMTGCMCKCMSFGSEFKDCDAATFINRYGDVCAYCYGSECETNFSGFGGWSFIL